MLDNVPPSPADDLASDTLRGAAQIAVFLYGTAEARRRVYHLVDTSKLPVFRLGSLLCARREWIAKQERRNYDAGTEE